MLSGDKYCKKAKFIKDMLKDVSRFEKTNFSDYILKINFDIKQLAFMNINLELMIN